MLTMLAATVLVRAGNSNAALQAQAAIRLDAVRLAGELSAWTHRGGHRTLGMPLAAALATEPPADDTDCNAGDCDAAQAGWHFLNDWRRRLRSASPSASLLVCIDALPDEHAVDWACRADGDTLVLKIGWPAANVMSPPVIVSLGEPD